MTLQRLLGRLAVLSLCAATPLSAQYTYDVTRSWTMCTQGAPSTACGRVALRTAGLEGGGSVVSIGVANLQGSDARDNTAASLLNRVGFHGSSSQSSTESRYLSGFHGGGGSLSGNDWHLSGAGGWLTLYAFNTYQLEQLSPRQIHSTYYYGVGSPLSGGGYAAVQLGSSDETYFAEVNDHYTYEGIAGRNFMPERILPRDETPHYGSIAGYDSYFVCDRRGAFGCLSSHVEYRPHNNLFFAGFTDHFVKYDYSAVGNSSGADDMMWFSVASSNSYDARLVDDIDLGGFARDDNYNMDRQFSCVASRSTCSAVEDLQSGVAPEPATLGLLATGLAGLAGIRIRRRKKR